MALHVSLKPGEFSLGHKHEHKHKHKRMCKQVKTGRHKHKHKHKKNGQVGSSCACAYAYIVALISENGVQISTSISTGPLNNHRSLWPEPMRTYQKQYGGRSVRHLVYNRVQESWYRELSQICHSARAHVLVLMLTGQWKPGFKKRSSIVLKFLKSYSSSRYDK